MNEIMKFENYIMTRGITQISGFRFGHNVGIFENDFDGKESNKYSTPRDFLKYKAREAGCTVEQIAKEMNSIFKSLDTGDYEVVDPKDLD